MARPSKYPVRHYVRLSHKTDKLLTKRARIMGLTPGEVLRVMTEHALSDALPGRSPAHTSAAIRGDKAREKAAKTT